MGKDRKCGERRRFNRFEVRIPVECAPVTPGKKYTVKELVLATVRNISINGILLRWPRMYQLPKFLRLAIEVISYSKPIDTVARTVWTKGKISEATSKGRTTRQYDVGLSFVENEHSRVPRLISLGTDFYWDIFMRTGDVQAYLLHKGTDKGCEEVPKDG